MMSSGLNKIINISILVALYIGGLFLASFILNHNNESSARSVKLTDSELPVLVVQTDNGNHYNFLYGYKNTMNVQYIHDSLAVVSGKASKLSFKVMGYKDEELRIDYEIVDYPGNNTYDRMELETSGKKGEEIFLEIPIKSILVEDKELMLHIILYQGHDTPIHYYMRVQQGYARLVDNYIEYIEEFVDDCIEKDKKIARYIEPTPQEDNTNPASVNIHSSYENITFGELKPQREGRVQIELCEMNDDVAMFNCRYKLILNKDQEEDSGQLEVTEHYRLRKGADRVILLNFERNIRELFKPDDDSLGKNRIRLGMTSGNLEYLATDKGDKIFFKKNRRLWAYNNNSGHFTEVSLWVDTGMSFHNRYDMKLLNMDQAGNVDFLLYGYIPGGEHEGMNGIILYRYDADLNSVIERLTIHSDRGFAYIKKGIDNLAYLGVDNKFYIEVGDEIYGINLSSISSNALVEEKLKAQMASVSESKRYLAYVEEGESLKNGIRAFEKIWIKDLMNASMLELKAKKNQFFMPLGFLGDDLVYGEYELRDIGEDRFGHSLLPARKIKIISMSGELKKEYSSKKSFIKNIEINDSSIEIYRLKKKSGIYISETNDRIIYSRANDQESVEFGFDFSEDRGRKKQGVLILPVRISEGMHRVLKPVLAVDTNATVMNARGGESTDHYYVFRYGDIIQLYNNLIPAINYAYEHIGAVVHVCEGTIWQRTSYSDSYVIDYDSIDERYYLMKTLNSSIKEQGSVQALNGVELNNILYFIKHDIPILANTKEKGRLLITGYDTYNIIMRSYNDKGELSEEFYYGKNDSETLFTKNNNSFLYLK